MLNGKKKKTISKHKNIFEMQIEDNDIKITLPEGLSNMIASEVPLSLATQAWLSDLASGGFNTQNNYSQGRCNDIWGDGDW
jgi:hypothetical protein